MSEGLPPTPERIRIRCPHCAATFRVRPNLIGRSGPCRSCNAPFTITPDLVIPDETERPRTIRASGGRLPESHARTVAPVPLRRILLPPVAVVFVPATFLLGLWIWLATRQEVQHDNWPGSMVRRAWWLVYPLIGYYVSMGWVAAGSQGCREVRLRAMQVAITLSNMFITFACMLFGMLAGAFGGRGGRNATRSLQQLWTGLNSALIQVATAVLGRLASAWLIAIPQTVWHIVRPNQNLNLGGTATLHVLGLLPGLIVFFLFLAPLSDQAAYHRTLAATRPTTRTQQPRVASVTPGQQRAASRTTPENPQATKSPTSWGDPASLLPVTQFGAKSALTASMPQPPGIDAIAAALAQQYPDVRRRGDVLYIPLAGPRSCGAWIRADGVLAIACNEELSSPATGAAIKVTWDQLTAVRGIPAPRRSSDKPFEPFEQTCEFHTLDAQQYQRLLLWDTGSFGNEFKNAVLSWPAGKATWGLARRLITSPYGRSQLTVQGKELIPFSNSLQPMPANIADLPFGELSVTGRISDPILFDAFFAKPSGVIGMRSGEGRLQNRVVVSLPLTSLTLPDLRQDPPVTAPPIPQTPFSASNLGFRGAVEVDLGGQIPSAPAERSLRTRAWSTRTAEGAVLAWHPDHPGFVACVSADGRVIALSRKPLVNRATFVEMTKLWHEAARAVAAVTATTPENKLDARFREKARFFTELANQYQSLYVTTIYEKTQGWMLDWPGAQTAWAVASYAADWRKPRATGWTSSSWAVAGVPLPCPDSDARQISPVAADLPPITKGCHPLDLTALRGSSARDNVATDPLGNKYWLTLEACFPQPAGIIALYDGLPRSPVARAEYSRPISALALPPSDAYRQAP